MKKVLFLLFALVSTTAIFGQKAQASPAATAKGKIGDAEVTISYFQPAVKGRKVWGELVPFDKVWRTGANNATTIELSKDVKVEGQKLAAGKYSLFTIPTEKGEWTVIFNKTTEQWGAYKYDQKDDVLRVKVKSRAAKDMTERMTFAVEKNAFVLMWEKLEVPVSLK